MRADRHKGGKKFPDLNIGFKNLILAIILVAAVGGGLFIYEMRRPDAVINVYGTTDLHSYFSDSLRAYLKKVDKKDSLILDSGDIIGTMTGKNREWMRGFKTLGVLEEGGGYVMESFAKEKEGTGPIIRDMADCKYDAATLGNHEFLESTPTQLVDLIKSMEDNGIAALSANTYLQNGRRLCRPYIIKDFKTPKGIVKVAVIGVTTNTISQQAELKDGKLIETDNKYLRKINDYPGKMYMTDMVTEAIKVAKEVKEIEKPDVIILCAHSGESARTPNHTGNRIEELCERVPYLDLVMAGHTHVFIDKHTYKGPNGKKIVVNQAGVHSRGVSDAKLLLKKTENGWRLLRIKSKTIEFQENPNDENSIDFHYKGPKYFNKEQFERLKREKPDKIFISYAFPKPKGVTIPEKSDEYEFEKKFKNQGMKFDYENNIIVRMYNYDDYIKFGKKYDKDFKEKTEYFTEMSKRQAQMKDER